MLPQAAPLRNYNNGTGRIRVPNNQCFDVPSGRFVNGARLQLWDCIGGSAQVFRT